MRIMGVDNHRVPRPPPDGNHRGRIPRTQERDGLHRQSDLLAAEVKSATPASQQPARDTQSDEFSMQKKDLELTATPCAGGVEVDD